MKIKKSDLEKMNELLDEVNDLLNAFLDFADDSQVDYTYKLLDKLRSSQDKIKEVIK